LYAIAWPLPIVVVMNIHQVRSSLACDDVAARLYSRDELLGWSRVWCVLAKSAVTNIRELGLRRRRGVRAGCYKQRPISVVNLRCQQSRGSLELHGCSGELPTIIGNRRNTSMDAAVDNKASPLKQEIGGYVKKPAPCLKKIRISRHTVASSHQLTFGLLNVQSANNKIDDIIDMNKEHGLDVMLLSETWHDADSVSIRRLRAEGLQVIERSRPRSSMIGVNHGGVAIVASHGVRLSTSDAVNKRAVHTFEHSCVRVVSQGTSCTVLLIYRPGSIVVNDEFFIEVSSLLHDLATLVEPVFITGDLNIRLDRPDDVNARKLLDLFETHDFTCRVNTPTHNGGGLLNVVATHNDLAVYRKWTL